MQVVSEENNKLVLFKGGLHIKLVGTQVEVFDEVCRAM